MSKLRKSRFLIARRIVQLSILVLFMAANYWGLKVLQGNFSAALVLDSFYLSDPHAFLQTLFAGFIVGTDIIIGVIIIFAFYALIGGRSFCSWVCPVNIIADIALYIRRILKIETDMIRYSRKARYYILALGLIMSAITSIAAFELINPITFIQRALIFGLWSGLSVTLLILALDVFIKKNAWCGSLCPLGAFYSLITKINIIKVHHKKEMCTNCGICFEVCPEAQVLDGVINEKTSFIFSGECTNCGRCIEQCDDKALAFGINKLKFK